MFLDQQLMFSDAQAVAASGASTNVVDLAQYVGGRGRTLPFEGFIFLTFSAQAGTTPTVQVDVQAAPGTIASGGATPDFTAYTASAAWPASGVASNPVVAGRSRTLPLSANMLNRIYLIPVQPNTPLYAALSAAGATSGPVRYFRLNYTLGGTTPSCTVTAGFVQNIESVPGVSFIDG
jgi:hypothetical protein